MELRCRILLSLALGVLAVVPAGAAVTVRDSNALAAALRAAAPGTTVLLQPGDYPGGLYFANLKGSPGKPIVIGAVDPARPPRIVGGANNLHLSEVAYLELHDLVLTGARSNGINIDDGGTFETPSHHVVLRNVRVSDVAAPGNYDGIKLSGLQDFRVENCTVERFGGQGIDMVGCHRGVIEGCTFRQEGDHSSVGVQAKGGSSQITVRRCRFVGLSRGVNLGGSTGMPFFRPKPQGYEAKEIVVEGCIFERCQAPVAFVGVDGAVVRYNTIYRPGRWALRILQETRAPEFVPCRNGVFQDNVVVFQSGSWFEGGVNIGPGTAPHTFRFSGNVWFCEDRPERSRPSLPTPEQGGIVGRDPLLIDPERADFGLHAGSPAAGKGHTGLR
ncbi:MAG: right-handed parallel beta-helix repeat-containing protein [Armatimonadota bacterium]|nr:right-handed parallel beta-helix repeat-containing protein [Armatimonadota bacterium]